MADWNKVGAALGGFAAGWGGTGPQYMAMMQNQRLMQEREKERERLRQQQQLASRDDRTKNLALTIRSVGQLLDAGNVDRAVTLLGETALGAKGTQLEKVPMELYQGITQAEQLARSPDPVQSNMGKQRLDQVKKFIKDMDQEFVTRFGLPSQQGGEIISPNDIGPNGTLATMSPAGQVSTQTVPGYENYTGGNRANSQISGTRQIKDSNNNLYSVASVFDPATGTTKPSYTPLGDAPEFPQGKIEFVGDDGLTPSERIAQAGLQSGTARAAQAAVDRSAQMFDQLGSVDQQIALLDDAKTILQEGADTGPIMNMLPSFRSAAVNLDNVQRQLGLNIIQQTTFGALSEGELNLALSTALPTNLQPDQLISWIENKQTAQRKLSNYLKQASIFLGTPGNTVADWLKYQENSQIMGSAIGGQQSAAPQGPRYVYDPETRQLIPAQ